MDKEILKTRTKSFSIEIGKLVMPLSCNVLNKNYSNQIVRCSSSVNPEKKETITVLWKEANELLSIIVASLITLRKSFVQS